MKKVKLNGRLSLNKETIAKLNDNQMNDVRGGKGGGVLSISRYCSHTATGCFGEKNTAQLFCNKN